MKIAILGPLDTAINQDALGGTEIWTYHYAEKLVASGHSVTLFASEKSKFSGSLVESAKRSDVEIPGKILRVDKEKIIDFSIRQIQNVIAKQDDFDVIHISNCNFFFYLPYIKNFHKPVVITVHSYNFSGGEAGDLFEKYPLAFYVFNAESFKKTWPEPDRYEVIYTGINLDSFEFNGNPENYIFWMGRIHKDKGIEDAVKFAQDSGEKLIIAGPVRNQEYFDLHVKPFLSDKIKFVGEANHEQKVNYYKNAKAFLMTTKRDESFGLVAAEAMACGTPVLTYGRGALPEIVENGITGYVVDPDNIEQLIEKSRYLDQIGRINCRERVEENFNIEIMVRKYIKLFQKLLEESI